MVSPSLLGFFIFNFENSMPETLTDLLYGAWLGTTGMCFSVG